VKQCEGAADVRVTQSRKPAPSFRRQARDELAYGLDEQQLGEPRKHRSRADVPGPDLAGGEAE
jgi:hypothetical protein